MKKSVYRWKQEDADTEYVHVSGLFNLHKSEMDAYVQMFSRCQQHSNINQSWDPTSLKCVTRGAPNDHIYRQTVHSSIKKYECGVYQPLNRCGGLSSLSELQTTKQFYQCVFHQEL